MLLAPPDYGRPDPVRLPYERGGAGPAPGADQVGERFPDGGRRLRRRLGPPEPGCPGLHDGDEHEPGPQLRHPVLAGVHELPPDPVSQPGEPGPDLRAVAVEPAVCQPPHVLQHDRPRPGLRGEPDRLGEQVPLVVAAELQARDGKRRARHPAGDQVGKASVGVAVDVADVIFDDLPRRSAVQA